MSGINVTDPAVLFKEQHYAVITEENVYSSIVGPNEAFKTIRYMQFIHLRDVEEYIMSYLGRHQKYKVIKVTPLTTSMTLIVEDDDE